MKQAQFEEVIGKQLEMIKETLLVKSKEYATVDKLHNFRSAAIMQQCTMEQALAGMLCKHTVSIYDMIHSGDRFHVDKWDEKINDHIVYLLLLRAIIEEKVTNASVVDIGNMPYMCDNPTYSEFTARMEGESLADYLRRDVGCTENIKDAISPPPDFIEKTFNVPAYDLDMVVNVVKEKLRQEVRSLDKEPIVKQINGSITIHEGGLDKLAQDINTTIRERSCQR